MVTEPSRLISYIIKIPNKPGINMIVHLLNQIVIVGVISAEWYLALLTTALRKKYFPERENYKGLKLAYQILKIVKRVTEMTRQQINVNELQFTFITSNGTTDALLIKLKEKYLNKKEFFCHISRFGKSLGMLFGGFEETRHGNVVG